MSFRTFKGNVLSEAGWRMCNADECNWITVRGTDVNLQIRKGIPTIILGEFAARFNEIVEPLRDPDSACWTQDNDVDTSNHPAGVACDFNWNSHPFHASGTFGDRLPRLRSLLDEFEGCVWWGGDWQDPIDEMHFQLNYREGYLDDNGNFVYAPDERLADLAAKITARQPKSVVGLIIDEANARNYNRVETIAIISTGKQESNLDQNATDSTGHRGVFQQDGGYPNRETAEGNIKGFFDRLDAKRASPGASQDIWKNIFWLQQRPSEPSADSAYANGRKAYLTEIQSHIDEATALYDQYVGETPTPAGEVMFTQLDSDRIAQIWGALFNPVTSQSRYADPKDTWGTKDFIRNDDGFLFDLITEHDAALGDPAALARIQKKAGEGDLIAQHFLDKLSTPTVLPPTESGGSPGTLANDLTCWQCGKAYPSVLEKCPFCGANPTPPAAASLAEKTSAAAEPTPVSTLITYNPVKSSSSVPSESVGDVAKQLGLLKKFEHELSPEAATAIDNLLPILEKWAGE